MNDNVIIRTENLCKYYGESIHALDDVSTEIHKGEVVVVIGPSGSGKSTFLRSLNLLETATSGKVYFEGTDITDPKVNINIHRQKMGMVFQHFNLFPHMTILRNMTLAPMKLLKLSKAEAEQRARELLSRVGLGDRADTYPSRLSGGQKQRVAIAGVIAMKPKIIIFDEPTAMLDPSGRKEVMNTIRSLNEKYNITIILITHNMDEAVQAKRVVVINDGVIVCDGSPREVFSDVEKMRTLGLDVPQATYLAYLLRKRGLPVKQDVLNADECIEELEKICR